MDQDSTSRDPVPWEFEEVLDLHGFKPMEVSQLLQDYFEHAEKRAWSRVRIIHGKGVGNLRRTVHAELARRGDVESFRLAPSELGGWGATVVYFKRRRRDLE